MLHKSTTDFLGRLQIPMAQIPVPDRGQSIFSPIQMRQNQNQFILSIFFVISKKRMFLFVFKLWKL